MIGFLIGMVAAGLLLFLLYILSTRCKKAGSGMRKLRPYAYAHRGLHNAARPENSLSAFRAAKSAGYGVELDIHLLKDGTLAVFHDHDLSRITGQSGVIEELTAEDLWRYNLLGSIEHIPTFREVLNLFEGKVPMIVELKSDGKNYNALAEAACQMLDSYKGLYCVESFDPRCLQWLRRNRPDVLRGQLTENFFKSPDSKLPGILKFLMTHQIFNFTTQPDFVAYRFSDRKRLSNSLVKKLWGAARVTWTIQTIEEYRMAKKEGWIPIFEGFEP